jgi:hypothetical protein
VAREQVLERGAQVVEERLPAARRQADLARHAERGVIAGGPALQPHEVRLHVLDEVQQVAEAELVLRATSADRADEARGEPVRARDRLVDALGDAVDAALVHPVDQAGVTQPLDVVVDALRRLPEHGADLRARTRFGQLAQHLDPLGLEQRLRLVEPIDQQQLLHDEESFDVKELLVNWAG